jgi:hypothetical protein
MHGRAYRRRAATPRFPRCAVHGVGSLFRQIRRPSKQTERFVAAVHFQVGNQDGQIARDGGFRSHR